MERYFGTNRLAGVMIREDLDALQTQTEDIKHEIEGRLRCLGTLSTLQSVYKKPVHLTFKGDCNDEMIHLMMDELNDSLSIFLGIIDSYVTDPH